MSEEELIAQISAGNRIYCLLTTEKVNYTEVYLGSICSGGYPDGYLTLEESPFDFSVFYTEPQSPNSWYGRCYYRTAIPVDSNRKRLKEQ